MISEPYKIKEVKELPRLETYERWNVLKSAGFNTYNVTSDAITFDMVAKGMSSWSHFQKAGFMIGDEAYAGSRNYRRLQQVVKNTLGIEHIVPTHNGIGAEKLLVTTMLKKGQLVPTNRGRTEGLVPANGGEFADVTNSNAALFADPDKFGADIDIARLEQLLKDKGKEGIAYVHVESCPDAWNGQPISLNNVEK